VNGGLARSFGRRVKPSAGASGEGSVASRPHRPRRARSGARPRVARERHPAVTTSPKAVACSRDRGCNDHRILRRVSCRQKASWVITKCFGHAKHSRLILALRPILRPAYLGQKPTAQRKCSPREGEGGARLAAERDRGVRGSIASAPWEENAHAHENAVRPNS